MHHRRAFTLLELLFVIGAVILLIGILVPGLRLVNRSGMKTVCLNNLRQLQSNR